MVKTSTVLIASLAILSCSNSEASISLFEWGINRDGVITGVGDPLPPGSIFDTNTGLGTVQLTFTGTGTHHGILFVDHDMSEGVNTYFNEVGQAVGVPSTGLSWEIDEPGFVFGDIFGNFQAGTLDNTVGTTDPNDVSMALGWQFNLGAGEQAVMNFFLTETVPTGFYLRHRDPDSDEQLFFTTSLTISTAGTVPDAGSTLALLLAGIGVVIGITNVRRK